MDDHFRETTKSPNDESKYLKEAARWISVNPGPEKSIVPKGSKLSSLTAKFKSLILSKDKHDPSKDTDPTFHQFSLLPNEIQVQIWTYAVQAPLIHKTNYGIISSHRLNPSSSSMSTSTTALPDSNPDAILTKPTVQTSPQTLSSKTLAPFFSLSDPIPSPNPHNHIFFPIAPLLHTCSLSRHIFQREWEPRLPEHLRGIIARTGKWVVLMTRVLEEKGQGILVLEEKQEWVAVGKWLEQKLDRREGKVITYYLFNYK